jgi:hypothetical protein
MKRILHVLIFIASAHFTQAQITSPVIVANFGVDADLRTNYFDGFLSAGNDDWFGNGDPGPGAFIIDTTGAAYIRQRYITTPSSRLVPFFRGMRYPQFSVVNNMMLIDGIFIRDHHGDDSTVFASGSNKNGMSPQNWSCPVSQGIPDKNDILDMFMHVRRAGPNGTDPLWMVAGLSLDNTTGNRYFDFEMYQTDIVYNRPTLSFVGYGPDFGHTTWEFDASGNVIKAGDIIFTAEYGSSSLSAIEARIWVQQTSLSITPTAFSWGGSFDGGTPGATYGYASIVPKTSGDFYTGLQCGNNTWGGPFNIVLQDNSIVTNYSARQFMEFSVNLSKLGLDPLVNMGDPCKMPFRRILVKSRASTSFTAELKDFVGPFSFFRAPAMEAASDVPYFCGSSDIRTISIQNPLVTSLYQWSTPDGNIISDNIGPEIQVNLPGTYIVSQELMDSCGSTFARDTVVLPQNNSCIVLNTGLLSFHANAREALVDLDWQVTRNSDALFYQLERSSDNVNFSSINKQYASSKDPENAVYNYTDAPEGGGTLFYRLKIVDRNGHAKYSRTVVVSLDKEFRNGFTILPNPVRDRYSLLVTTELDENISITVSDMTGRIVDKTSVRANRGSSLINMTNPPGLAPGTYAIRLVIGKSVYSSKMIYTK